MSLITMRDPHYGVFQVCLMWLAIVMFFIATFLGRSALQTGDRKGWRRYEVLVLTGQFLQTIVCWLMLMNEHLVNFVVGYWNMNNTSTIVLWYFTAFFFFFSECLILLDLFRLKVRIRIRFY